MKMKRLGFIFVVLIGIVSASEKDFIDVPCADYKEGAEWTTHAESELSSIDTITKVRFIQGNQIELKIATTTKHSMHGMSMESTDTAVRYLTKVGDTVYHDREEKNMQVGESGYINTPAAAICGKVPKSYIYTSVFSLKQPNFSTQSKSKYTVSTKKLGEKNVEVSVGKFKAKVFQNSIKVEILDQENASITEIVNINYVVDKVGEIKKETMSITHMPDMANIPKKFTKAMPKEFKTNIETELVSYK